MADKDTILAVIDADAEDLSAAERAAYFAESSGARIELFSAFFHRCKSKLHQQLRQIVTCYRSHRRIFILPYAGA